MDDDPVERSGCARENEAVLLCYDAKKDWRACKKELDDFKRCIQEHLHKNEVVYRAWGSQRIQLL